MIRLICYILLPFICSCAFGYSEFTRKLAAENDELEKLKPVNICGIEKSSKYIKATISIKHSDIQTIKSAQKSEGLLVSTCYSQPHPKLIKADMTPWGKRLWFDFTHFYGLANGYPGNESSLRYEAIKNCAMLLSDYRSYHKHYEVPASCNIAKCQVCEY
jgi:hypothetical protein